MSDDTGQASEAVPETRERATIITTLACSIARDAEYADENQDAFAVDESQGRVAIADGVSSGYYSSYWARLLSDRFVANGCDFSRQELPDWIVDARREWSEKIDIESMNYFQKKKFHQVKGGYTTFLWLQFHTPVTSPDERRDDGNGAQHALTCLAVGDCNLFQIRNHRLVDLFPWKSSEDYGLAPSSIGSTDLGRDGEIETRRCSLFCRVGDQFLLATDAVAEYLTKSLESDDGFEWSKILEMPECEFASFVVSNRDKQLMTRDDSTLIRFEISDIGKTPDEHSDLKTVAKTTFTPHSDSEFDPRYAGNSTQDQSSENESADEGGFPNS